MTIEISAENLAKIDAAVASGAFASREEAVSAAIARGLPATTPGYRTQPIRSMEEAVAWVADLKKWVATLPPGPANFDDSRDSIYSGTMDDTR
ncbi:hypothetical protein Pla175_02800 [Pirellulimonas nuda]|uniref:Uncharacterized protein n=1 Tax=Pirellulimonas nuda TaxID=2528009 RepID=A0A518D629_9BACT|nr:ribbon-helix-helix domain-containing protein [Pirellulimonas nuda]QDU86926.1 hypothetical protein Pla175_02800 [Pirellulimonas nuda]